MSEMPETHRKMISIVIPVFNEQENVPELCRRLAAAVSGESYDFEFIFIDDGSSDKTFSIVEELGVKDSRVKGISLSRNFGHQTAIFAGIEAAAGNAVIMMDGDLQHPPEMIPQMLRKWEQGHEIVSTVRDKTEDSGVVKKLTAGIFYTIINKVGNVNIEKNAADFRLIDSSVAAALCEMRERARFLRGLISWVGYSKVSIPYSAPRRHAGETKYSPRKMLMFALDAVVSFSAFPLRMSAFLGVAAVLLGLLYSLFIIYEKINGKTVQGWTSLMAVIIFFGGVQLVMLGIIGEYISRIYEETKQRPLYLVRKKTGFGGDVD